jgi:hypothetical protein
VDSVTLAITTCGPLLGVLVGSLLSSRSQGRLLASQRAQDVNDARRQTYLQFLEAVRHYVAYTQSSDARIEAVPDEFGNEVHPVLDAAGTPYRLRMDAGQIAVRMQTTSLELVARAHALVTAARTAAASRKHHQAGQIPPELYHAIWAEERRFVDAARTELGLPAFDADDPRYSPGLTRRAARQRDAGPLDASPEPDPAGLG